jgi:hypothetical protein
MEAAMEESGDLIVCWGDGGSYYNEDLFPEWPARSRTWRIPW